MLSILRLLRGAVGALRVAQIGRRIGRILVLVLARLLEVGADGLAILHGLGLLSRLGRWHDGCSRQGSATGGQVAPGVPLADGNKPAEIASTVWVEVGELPDSPLHWRLGELGLSLIHISEPTRPEPI
eukprot:9478587-Pyramimonas_sp.AAC.1